MPRPLRPLDALDHYILEHPQERISAIAKAHQTSTAKIISRLEQLKRRGLMEERTKRPKGRPKSRVTDRPALCEHPGHEGERILPPDDFSVVHGSLASYCKSCHNREARRRYHEDEAYRREKIKDSAQRALTKKNDPEWLEKRRTYNREYATRQRRKPKEP